eukprot:267436_1
MHAHITYKCTCAYNGNTVGAKLEVIQTRAHAHTQINIPRKHITVSQFYWISNQISPDLDPIQSIESHSSLTNKYFLNFGDQFCHHNSIQNNNIHNIYNNYSLYLSSPHYVSLGNVFHMNCTAIQSS